MCWGPKDAKVLVFSFPNIVPPHTGRACGKVKEGPRPGHMALCVDMCIAKYECVCVCARERICKDVFVGMDLQCVVLQMGEKCRKR